LLRTVPSSRIFTRSASTKTTGYKASSGRDCHAVLGDDRVRDRADQIRRHVHGVHLEEEGLDLAHRQTSRLKGDDLVVETGEAPFVLANQPRLEGALAIARHRNR
jgi:hypothetical protein